jgi:hypothetical protein
MTRTPLTRLWTDEDVATLREMLASGVTLRTAALKLRRKLNGVRSKIAKIQARQQEHARQRRAAPKPGEPPPVRVSDGTF